MKLFILVLIYAFLTLLPSRAETIGVHDNDGGRVADCYARWDAELHLNGRAGCIPPLPEVLDRRITITGDKLPPVQIIM